MAYKSRFTQPIVDRTYPSEIAAQRPALATRIHCPAFEPMSDNAFVAELQDSDESIRGRLSDDRCASFNRALRGGHAGRNDGDE